MTFECLLLLCSILSWTQWLHTCMHACIHTCVLYHLHMWAKKTPLTKNFGGTQEEQQKSTCARRGLGCHQVAPPLHPAITAGTRIDKSLVGREIGEADKFRCWHLASPHPELSSGGQGGGAGTILPAYGCLYIPHRYDNHCCNSSSPGRRSKKRR